MTPELILRAVNHLLEGATWARERLAPFGGQQVRIEGLPLPLMLALGPDGRVCPPDPDAPAQVTITLPPETPWLMLVDRPRIFASSRLAGSADLAEALAFVARHLRWDVEADLADWVGDIAAHRLVRAGRQLKDWQGSAMKNLAANTLEYVIEEKRWLATAEEIDHFSRDVATLRDDLARLEKRIRQLG